jgi:hypothetical protein
LAKPKKISGRVQAAVAGCVSTIAAAVGTLFMVILGFGIMAKDTIANYAPGLVAGTPIAFLFAPPQADSPIKTTDQYGCELNWNRDLTGKRIEYTVMCNAKTKLEIRNLKVEVISPNEDDIFETGTIDVKEYAGPQTCKDKDAEGWPVDVPCYVLDDDERIEEVGTLLVDSPLHPDLGKFRRVRVTADIRYPDDEGKPDKSDKYRLRIASGEGE